MTSVPETPSPRKVYERALRRMAERQEMRLVRSTRRDSTMPSYGTYTLIRRSRSLTENGIAILKHVSLQAIEKYLHENSRDHRMVAPGERTDAIEGSIVGVYPGVIIDNLKNDKRFLVAEDGEFIELPDEGWADIPDDGR
jgi:hypothetical protein